MPDTQSRREGFATQFLKESSIHGLRYLGFRNLHIIEKIFWLFAVLTSLAFSILQVLDLYGKLNESPVIISYKSQETHVHRVPFPAITICNVNIMKKEILERFYQLINITSYDLWEDPENLDKIAAFHDTVILNEHMTHYCLSAPSFRRLIHEIVLSDSESDLVEVMQDYLEEHTLSGAIPELTIDNVTTMFKGNFSANVKEASHHCQDMIVKCMWSREDVPCHQIFRSIRTHLGHCCVFNMMPKTILRKSLPKSILGGIQEEKKFLTEQAISDWEEFDEDDLLPPEEEEDLDHPKHQKAGGVPYGLSILVNPELDTYSTCTAYDGYGFKMLAHSPISFPGMLEYGTAISPGSEVFVDIEPHVTIANQEELGSLDIDKRGCYFRTDNETVLDTYHLYSRENCMDECIAKFTYQTCGCVRYFMPRNSTQKLCGAKMLNCSEEANRIITTKGLTVQCSHCRPPCTEIVYKMHESEFPLLKRLPTSESHSNSMPSYDNVFEYDNKTARNYSIIHVYIGTDSLNVLERKKLYDIWDLLAQAGGALGLFLGFSVLSLAEFVYFFTFRAWHYYHTKVIKSDSPDHGNGNRDAGLQTLDEYYSRSGPKGPRLSGIVKRGRLAQFKEYDKRQSSKGYNAKKENITALAYTNWKIRRVLPVSSTQDQSLSEPMPYHRPRVHIPPFHLLSSSSTQKKF